MEARVRIRQTNLELASHLRPQISISAYPKGVVRGKMELIPTLGTAK